MNFSGQMTPLDQLLVLVLTLWTDKADKANDRQYIIPSNSSSSSSNSYRSSGEKATGRLHGKRRKGERKKEIDEAKKKFCLSLHARLLFEGTMIKGSSWKESPSRSGWVHKVTRVEETRTGAYAHAIFIHKQCRIIKYWLAVGPYPRTMRRMP